MPAVKIENVSKKFSSADVSINALTDVSFEIEEGEIFGLLGPNGAGKTTLISIMAGIVTPETGDAQIYGMHCAKESTRIQKIINVVSGFTGVPYSLSCEEALKYYAYLYGIRDQDSKIREVARLTNSEYFLKQQASDISSGMRQRFMIAKALINDPKIIILDEPTVGLDVESSVSIRNLIGNLKKEGRTILLTTHNMKEAEELCDRIAFINKGKIIAVGTAEELKKKIRNGKKIQIVTDDQEETARSLRGYAVKKIGEKTLEVTVRDDMKKVLKTLSGTKCRIHSIGEVEPSLEETYLEYMRGNNV